MISNRSVQGWNKPGVGVLIADGPGISDPDDRGGGCEGRGGAAVVVQVDHGVVGGSHAAKGSACAHLSVSQALQVTLRGRRQRERETQVRLAPTAGWVETGDHGISTCRTRHFLGETDRCQ